MLPGEKAIDCERLINEAEANNKKSRQ
jgi:hypothetical protein